jgi:hypothetical protein
MGVKKVKKEGLKILTKRHKALFLRANMPLPLNPAAWLSPHSAQPAWNDKPSDV